MEWIVSFFSNSRLIDASILKSRMGTTNPEGPRPKETEFVENSQG
jgi:hypothetical protein